jgi:hypothetical protein
MLDDMRKYVRFGLQALSAQDPSEGGTKRSGTHTLGEQLSSLAAGFLEWSGEARASLLQELKDLVARQVEEMGVATKKELDALERRLEKLEVRRGTRPSRSKATSPTRAARSKATSTTRTARSKATTRTVTRKAKTSTSRAKGRASTPKTGGRGGRSTRGSR